MPILLTTCHDMRIYCPEHLEHNAVIALSKETSHRLLNVLRLKRNDNVILFNSNDGSFKAQLIDIANKIITIKIIAIIKEQTESPLNLHIGQALVKSDKMSYVIQKAIELGVKEITPIHTKYSEIKLKSDQLVKKLEHWNKIAIHASEQSGRNQIAKINKPVSFEAWVDLSSDLKIILHPFAKQTFSDIKDKPRNANLLVGPEGGFADEELDQAGKKGFIAINMGPRIVRTETAPIVALSVMQYLWGDLK